MTSKPNAAIFFPILSACSDARQKLQHIVDNNIGTTPIKIILTKARSLVDADARLEQAIEPG